MKLFHCFTLVILLIALLNFIAVIQCEYSLNSFTSTVTIKDTSCYVDIVETFTLQPKYPYPSQFSRFIPLYNSNSTSYGANSALKKNAILPKSVKVSIVYEKFEINYHEDYIELVVMVKNPILNAAIVTLSYQTNSSLYINDNYDSIVYNLNVGPIAISASSVKFLFSNLKDLNGYAQFYDYSNIGNVDFYENSLIWTMKDALNPNLAVSFPPLKVFEKCVHDSISEFTSLISMSIVNLIGIILILLVQFVVIIYLLVEKRKKKYAFLPDSNKYGYGSNQN